MPSRNRSRTTVKEHRKAREDERTVQYALPLILKEAEQLLKEAEQLLADPLSDVCWDGHEYYPPPPPHPRLSAEQRAAILQRMLGNIEAVEARLGFGKEG